MTLEEKLAALLVADDLFKDLSKWDRRKNKWIVKLVLLPLNRITHWIWVRKNRIEL